MVFNLKRYLGFFWNERLRGFFNDNDSNYKMNFEYINNNNITIDGNNFIIVNGQDVKVIGSCLLLNKTVPVEYFVYDINNIVNLLFKDEDNILVKIKNVKYLFLYEYSLLKHSYLFDLLNNILFYRLNNNLYTTIFFLSIKNIDSFLITDEIKKRFNKINYIIDKKENSRIF